MSEKLGIVNNMRRIILFIVFIVITVAAKAQCNQPYKSFDQFRNDTTAFLRYNFKTRADCYKGKTVAYVLKDLQLRPKSYVALYSTKTNKYRGICIFMDDKGYIDAKTKNQYIYIYWKGLLDDEGVVKLGRTYDSDIWVQQHYDFFKDNIVGEIIY